MVWFVSYQRFPCGYVRIEGHIRRPRLASPWLWMLTCILFLVLVVITDAAIKILILPRFRRRFMGGLCRVDFWRRKTNDFTMRRFQSAEYLYVQQRHESHPSTSLTKYYSFDCCYCCTDTPSECSHKHTEVYWVPIGWFTTPHQSPFPCLADWAQTGVFLHDIPDLVNRPVLPLFACIIFAVN